MNVSHYFRGLSTLVLLGVWSASAADNPSASPSFAPFESWKAAVQAGDRQALAKFYSAQPPARVAIGKTLTTVDDELRFWAGLKTSGIIDFDPKLLAIVPAPDNTRLVLRLKAAMPPGEPGNGQHLVASMKQVWILQNGEWRLAATQRSDFHPDAGRRLAEPAKPNTHLYSDPSEAEAELEAATAQAAKEHKRVLVVFGANWCYDCHVLDTTFHSKDFAPLVNANYVVVHINVGDEGKDNNDLAASLGVGLNRGIPSLGILGSNRTVIFAQRDGEFESTEKIGPEDVRAFLEKWKPAKK